LTSIIPVSATASNQCYFSYGFSVAVIVVIYQLQLCNFYFSVTVRGVATGVYRYRPIYPKISLPEKIYVVVLWHDIYVNVWDINICWNCND